MILRSDHGTENVAVGAIQIAFRLHHTDSFAKEKSFLYGPSTSNIVCASTCILYNISDQIRFYIII